MAEDRPAGQPVGALGPATLLCPVYRNTPIAPWEQARYTHAVHPLPEFWQCSWLGWHYPGNMRAAANHTGGAVPVGLQVAFPEAWEVVRPLCASPRTRVPSLWLVRDARGQEMVVYVPRRAERRGEDEASYLWRCWHQAWLASRLSQLKLRFVPKVQMVRVYLDDDRVPTLRTALESLSSSKHLDEASLQRLGAAERFACWGIATPYDPSPSLKALLRPGMEHAFAEQFAKRPFLLLIAQLAAAIAFNFQEAASQGLFYLPVHLSHAKVRDGQASSFVGLERVATTDELWLDTPGALRRLFAEEVEGQWEEDRLEFDDPVIFMERLAFRAFYRWLSRILAHEEAYGRTPGARWSRLREALFEIRNRSAVYGVDGRGYVRWSQLVDETDWVLREQAGRPSGSSQAPRVRMGVVLDYANVFTGLGGWSVDVGKLVEHLVYENPRRQVVFRRAAVVQSEERNKDRITQKLQQWGFQVEVLRSSTGRADQLDDRALCQYMLRHLNEIDELVLLTSDKHYWDAVWQYLQRGRHVVLIHFAPLSIVYPRSHTRLTVVNGVQRLWRLLRFEGRLTEL